MLEKLEKLVELLEPYMSGESCDAESGSCELSNCRTCAAIALANRLILHDVVPVVRCKDCKHRRDDEDFVSGHYCVKRPSNGGYFCEDNDFCSYGERRDGG